jgi:ABC-type multidrug transport system ATPase subunit
MKNDTLIINGLSKNYKITNILENIDLKLINNRIYFLMGKNGSGKTTFIKCLLELENFKGNITFGNNYFKEIRNSVFSIYDDIPLYNELNGYQNIYLMLKDNIKFDKNEILELSLLSKHKLKEKVKGYSLGERKKIAIISALLCRPKYLIIDEISNGLDIETLEILKESLLNLKQDSLILATGHHFEFYENIIDELLILHNKSIIQISDYKNGGENLHDIYKKHFSSN